MLNPMIEAGEGDLLRAETDALVNTVNTVGVMGKGLALQFRNAFPDNRKAYEQACRAKQVQVGEMFIVQRLVSPRFIINFPTKTHWRQKSRLSYITDGLADLVQQVRRRQIRSIALPPLGCGLGGLQWEEVRPLIVEAFAPLPDVRVVLFAPRGAPPPAAMINNTKTPRMTAGRAAVLALMNRYLSTGYLYRLALIEVQKLAYFLQMAGQPLRLEYKPHFYGPYADNLRKVLRYIEGHFTQGVGDGSNSPETEITLLPGAASRAEDYVVAHPDLMGRLERVAQLIEGFETPFGMELLGTVHWVMHHDVKDDGDVEEVFAAVQNWSSQKRSKMKEGHVRAAWERLQQQGWSRSS